MLSAAYRRVSFCLVRRISNDGAMLPRYLSVGQSKSHGSGELCRTETLDWRKARQSRRVDTISGAREPGLKRANQ